MMFFVQLIFGILISISFAASTIDIAQTSTSSNPLIPISAALVVSISCLGAGYAIAHVGTAAISLLAENEGAFFKGFLVVTLAEALAIYGLILGILLWLQI